MTTKPFEFEKSLKELEAITSWFESSDVDLDAGLAKFERGMELATELKAHLAAVENHVERIRQRFSAGRTEDPPPDPSAGGDQGDTDSAGQTDLFGA